MSSDRFSYEYGLIFDSEDTQEDAPVDQPTQQTHSPFCAYPLADCDCFEGTSHMSVIHEPANYGDVPFTHTPGFTPVEYASDTDEHPF
jgi:hypothetical protein